MQFEILPVIDQMISLYQQPKDRARFESYLKILSGTTDNDLEVPATYFNPMAKQHVLDKLTALQSLGAEEIMAETLALLNAGLSQMSKTIFKVSLSLADDAMGGWTNRYTTDYDSKFKINAFVKRNFCNPLFWVIEDIDETLIRKRTLEYVYRTIYCLAQSPPQTLTEHILQEKFVAEKSKTHAELSRVEFARLTQFYQGNKNSTAFPVIFNFLYGDVAAENLGFSPLGVGTDMAGFRFAALVN